MKISTPQKTKSNDLLHVSIISDDQGTSHVQISIIRRKGAAPILGPDVKIRALSGANKEIKCISRNPEELVEIEKGGFSTAVALFQLPKTQLPERVEVNHAKSIYSFQLKDYAPNKL